ncbi:hypothetical protein Nepgr_025927 [Nepenthes gracilis]|uniref:Uncharacterized protein n=1 Tax=Nepenthes gracilis TaxID=150966 RepID=A0AAD3T7E4_NEPGR|nr:hypothetical protein Nepgr_025927 [Nepenthes gracilis]
MILSGNASCVCNLNDYLIFSGASLCCTFVVLAIFSFDAAMKVVLLCIGIKETVSLQYKRDVSGTFSYLTFFRDIFLWGMFWGTLLISVCCEIYLFIYFNPK